MESVQASYAKDVLLHMERFKQQKYMEFEYNHKSD